MAHNWKVDHFEEFEPDMAHYVKMKKLRKKKGPHSIIKTFFYKHETKLKMLVSFLVFLGMVSF